MLVDAIEATEPGQEISLEIVREGRSNSETISGNIGEREMDCCKSMKMSHDFKGMNEVGNLLFESQMEMDEDEFEDMQRQVEQAMEEAQERLEQRQSIFQQENQALFNQGLGLTPEGDTMSIRIELEEVSDDEAAALARSAEDFDNENDLIMESISFFPNPSNGIVNLRFTLADDAPVDIRIYDERGNTVFNETRFNFGGTYDNNIDISGQADGIYFLQIIQGMKSFSKKIVKQR
ncbi:MAG: T9SS type A sorting domain-containing protein [Flavobacteriales bacterium]|nr:T9SS type A sorting domain-containing protein [Flavobacteriales bacterium]